MKSLFRTTLLIVWILSLSAPTLVTLFHNDDQAIIVMNFGEEEQEEQNTKDISEEKIIPAFPSFGLLIFTLNDNSASDIYFLGISNHEHDIPLPPPEHLA